jgi:hypothetical protein
MKKIIYNSKVINLSNMLKKILFSLVLVLGLVALAGSASAQGNRIDDLIEGNAPMLKMMETMRMYSSDQWAESIKSFVDARVADSDSAVPLALIAALVAAIALFKLLMTIVVVLLAVLVFKRQSKMLLDDTLSDFWHNALKGIIFLVIAPIILVGTAFTLIGLPLALIGGLIYILWLLIANVYSFVIAGAWAYHKLFKTSSIVADWRSALFGILVLYVVGMVPVIGGMVNFIVIMAVLGSIMHNWYKKIWLMRS